jgi:putative transposase
VRTKAKSLHRGDRFPATIINHAVCWRFRFHLSPRDIEELVFERGVTVSYETIRRWCEKFGAGFTLRAKTTRRKRFLKRVRHSNPVLRKIVTDQLRSYPAAKAEIPELLNVKYVFVKVAARVNCRAKNSHQPTRELLSSLRPIRQDFALKRHLLRASSIANSSRPGLSHGANSLTLPKLHGVHSEPQCLMHHHRQRPTS